jgi:RNA polymerase sigma-70 factor (ECF subfamily)
MTNEGPEESRRGCADASARARLSIPEILPLAYAELRALAELRLRNERSGHTLQATALAHEAYAKLAVQSDVLVNDVTHFLALASVAIRRVLVDHARTKGRGKRGGGEVILSLEDATTVPTSAPIDYVALDDELERLAQDHPRQAHVVELKFFGGLSAVRVGDILGVSSRTVEDDWAFARAWLRSRLGSFA